MALQKQVVAASLAGGLDTKTDPKQVPPGKLLTAENVVVKRTGELQKVDGTSTFLTNVTYQASIDSGKQLSVLGDELCLTSNSGFYAYSELQGQWNYRSQLSSCSVGLSQVASSTVSLRNPVCAVANNLALYAWVDTSVTSTVGNVVYTVVDLLSGSAVIAPTNIPNSLSTPRVIAVGRYLFLCYYTNGTSLWAFCLDSLTVSFSAGYFSITPGGAGTTNYDICGFQGGMAVVHATTSGDLYAYIYTSTSAAAVNAAPLGLTSTTSEGGVSLFQNQDNSNVIGLLYYQSGVGLSHLTFTPSFAVNTAAVLISSLTASNFSAVCYNGVSEIIYNGPNPASDPSIYPVCRGTVVLATNNLATSDVIFKGAVLTSKCFRVDGLTLFMAGYENTYLTSGDSLGLQTTNFILTADGHVQATVLPAKTGNLVYQFGSPAFVSSQKVILPVLQKGQVESEQGRLFTLDNVAATFLDFSATRFPPGQTLGEHLYLPGGFLKVYDGISVVETGFHLWPDLNTTAVSPTTEGVGSIAAGTYLYVAVYEWRDAKGHLHQSAPTYPPLSYQFNAGSKSLSLKYRALAFTEKRAENGRKDVSVVLYRTKDKGSVYYRVTPPHTNVLNDATARANGYVTLTDTTADSALTSNQILYTMGGELENVSTPAPSLVLTFKDRIFTVTGEDPSALYYSKQIVPGAIPGFNDLLRLPVNPQFGDITALGALDDKLVIFKKAAIYVVAGDGPLPTGQQDTFSAAAKLASDVGCSNQSSVVETPLGMMFQSEKGIYLLDRSLGVKYIGAGVEGFNSLTVTGAFVLAYANQIRFYTSAGTTLVYDYIQDAWTVRTREGAVAAVSWKGKAVYLRSNGQVAAETQGQAASDSSPVLTKVKTAFHSFAGLQGFQRVWRILVLGEFAGNHVLKVSVYTDFKSTADDTFYIAVGDSSFCASAAVVALTTTAATFTGGASDSAYEFSLKPRVQKCTSMALLFEDVFPTGVATKGFNISAVSFEVGAKGTAKKLNAATTLVKG